MTGQKLFILFSTALFSFSPLAIAGSHFSSKSISGHTPSGRHFAITTTRTAARGLSYNSNCYSPYQAYWNYYPTSNYYSGSFGYWGSSFGAYGNYYVQPNQYKTYNYGYNSYSSYYPRHGSVNLSFQGPRRSFQFSLYY